MIKVLFLCTGNSCRSIMAEALLSSNSKGKFKAYSAGSIPVGTIHPLSLKVLNNNNILTKKLYSKSINDISHIDMDIIITVCDNAAKETCPILPALNIKSHWGIEDPAKFIGNLNQIEEVFDRVFKTLEKRVIQLTKISFTSIDKNKLSSQIDRIGGLI